MWDAMMIERYVAVVEGVTVRTYNHNFLCASSAFKCVRGGISRAFRHTRRGRFRRRGAYLYARTC